MSQNKLIEFSVELSYGVGGGRTVVAPNRWAWRKAGYWEVKPVTPHSPVPSRRWIAAERVGIFTAGGKQEILSVRRYTAKMLLNRAKLRKYAKQNGVDAHAMPRWWKDAVSESPEYSHLRMGEQK